MGLFVSPFPRCFPFPEQLTTPGRCQARRMRSRRLEIRLPVSEFEWCPGCHPEPCPERSEGAAKDLSVRRARPFAEFTLSEANGLRMTGIISKCLDEKGALLVNNR